MDLDPTSKDTARDAFTTLSCEFFLYYQDSISPKRIECILARAIATEAWSQVVDSIISDNPPIDMSQEYYHSHPESGFDYLQEQLKHLEIYKYKLGTENIQARMRSDMDSLFEEAGECKGPMGLLSMDSEYSTESETYFELLQENEHGDEGLWNFKDSIKSNTYSQVVQADEVEDQQGIDNIQCPIRSAVRSEVVQADEVEDQQGIENIQCPIRSAVRAEVVQADEVEDQQGVENIQCPITSAVRSEGVQANEDEDQRGIENIQSPARTAVHVQTRYSQSIKHFILYGMHYKVVQENKGENEATTMTLENIQAKGLSVLFELLELVKNGDRDRTQESTPRSEVLELIKHLHDDGIGSTRMELKRVLLHLNDYYIEKDTPIQYIKEYIELMMKIFNTKSCQRTLCRMRGEVEGIPCECWEEMQAYKKISTLFDELLELVEKGDHVHGGEKPNLRFKVLKLIKVLHHYGVDTIRSAVKEALESVNRKYVLVEKDSIIGYKKKALEVMLRICDIQTCQKTLYEYIGTTESGQVLYT